MNAHSVAIAVLVLSAVVHGQTPSADRNPLDSAKRELQTLPQKQGAEQVLGGSRPGLGNAALPALTDPLSGSLPPTGPAQSPTWLQDTMDTVRSPREHSKLSQARDAGPKPMEADAAAYDPFDRYLTQWLSPRDLEILRPAQKSAAGVPSTSLVTELPGRTPVRSEPRSDVSTVGALRSQPWEVTPAQRNPYLDIFDPPAPVVSRAVEPQWDTAPATGAPQFATSRAGRVGGAPAPAGTPAPAPATLVPKPKPPQETAVPPPTAPVVDDRKYFPQLRRF